MLEQVRRSYSRNFALTHILSLSLYRKQRSWWVGCRHATRPGMGSAGEVHSNGPFTNALTSEGPLTWLEARFFTHASALLLEGQSACDCSLVQWTICLVDLARHQPQQRHRFVGVAEARA